jgi:hypothetical protein
MADNNRQDEQQKPRVGLFRRLANAVRNNSDELYKSTYYSDNNNKKQLDMIRTDITTSIKDIMDGTADVVGEPNISKLFERLLMNTQNDSKTVSEFERIFETMILSIILLIHILIIDGLKLSMMR